MPLNAVRPNVLSIGMAIVFTVSGLLVWRATGTVVPSGRDSLVAPSHEG